MSGWTNPRVSNLAHGILLLWHNPVTVYVATPDRHRMTSAARVEPPGVGRFPDAETLALAALTQGCVWFAGVDGVDKNPPVSEKSPASCGAAIAVYDASKQVVGAFAIIGIPDKSAAAFLRGVVLFAGFYVGDDL